MKEERSGDVIDNDSNDEWVVVAIFTMTIFEIPENQKQPREVFCKKRSS